MSDARRRRLPVFSINRLIPNALTLLALSAGLTAIRLAMNGSWELAVALIFGAAILDGLDGRIARMMGASSEFGAQLDSLSDVVSFGVAPALILYLWALEGGGGPAWAFTAVYVLCCALRLARFNVSLGDDPPSPETTRFFVGVPAPAAAGLVLLPMVFTFQFGWSFLSAPIVVIFALALVAALMVSRVPTYSMKRVRVPQRSVGLVLLCVGAFVALLVSSPWLTISLAGLAYIASIPIAYRAKKRMDLALVAEFESKPGQSQL